jgi:DNA-directed RNA polymerase subunit RPC12/RpoP
MNLYKCSKCKKDLNESCFSKNKDGKNGLQYWCKMCHSIHAKSYVLSPLAKLRRYIYRKEVYKNNKKQLIDKANLYQTTRDEGLFRKWCLIKLRCNNKNVWNYKYYGALGITVEWKSYTDFKLDLFDSYKEHIQIHGKENTSLDRINPFGNYSKENCRWVTLTEQKQNKRVHHNRG